VPQRALASLADRVEALWATTPFVGVSGKVVEASATGIKVAGLSPFLRLGAAVSIETNTDAVLGEVIRLEDRMAFIKPFDICDHIQLGTRVALASGLVLRPRTDWCGRVVDALGRPADGGKALPAGNRALRTDGDAPNAMGRRRAHGGVRTGVRVIDMFTPICLGQRIGIFAGSGIGKTTLLGMLARSRGFDRIVAVLVGERGREVREFVEETLGSAREKAVVVAATGDLNPMMRRLAPRTAMRIAENFRDGGESVLFIMDSITRYAHAAREVALAAGEPPVARGYPPSVFTDLPRLLERAGPGPEGSGTITGIFSVLVDGDDHNDPIADAIRGALDGHIVLDRAIAEAGRYPAVNVLTSVSRLAERVWTPQQRQLAGKLRALIARYEETRDLRMIGGYQAGSAPDLDRAVALVPRLYQSLAQAPGENPSQDAFRDIAALLEPQSQG
jgi:flagellum-specific ATP synthase